MNTLCVIVLATVSLNPTAGCVSSTYHGVCTGDCFEGVCDGVTIETWNYFCENSACTSHTCIWNGEYYTALKEITWPFEGECEVYDTDCGYGEEGYDYDDWTRVCVCCG